MPREDGVAGWVVVNDRATVPLYFVCMNAHFLQIVRLTHPHRSAPYQVSQDPFASPLSRLHTLSDLLATIEEDHSFHFFPCPYFRRLNISQAQ